MEHRKERIGEIPSFNTPNELVTFVIGEDDKAEKFAVHKEVACKFSPVLKAAFEGGFVEGKSQVYHLEEETADVFRLLVQWMYSQQLKIIACHPKRSTDTKEATNTTSKNEFDLTDESTKHATECAEQDRLLVRLWILADKLLIDNLQNLVVHEMIEIAKTCGNISVELYHHIYENTVEKSPLRRLIVALDAWYGGEYSLARSADDYPFEMMYDLVKYFQDQTRDFEEVYRRMIDRKDFSATRESKADSEDSTTEKSLSIRKASTG